MMSSTLVHHLSRGGLSFVMVGTLAAGVHYSLAIAGVMFAGLSPQTSNVCGYVIALLVSYIGQSRFTFADAARQATTFVRFATVSLSGFLLNYLCYSALLRWTAIDYRIALLIVLIGVAGLTYIALNKWVFVKQILEAKPSLESRSADGLRR
jgi:putative flippase GtrA